MKVKQLSYSQWLPIPLEEAWKFFSSPFNLNEITPSDLQFSILNATPEDKMYEGMIIRYQLTPLANIPVEWVTEITQVKENQLFIDEQRFGPYAFWHHQHHFEAKDGGTLMKDILHYKVPFGPLGSIANKVFVESKVKSIFDYRFKVLEEKYKK